MEEFKSRPAGADAYKDLGSNGVTMGHVVHYRSKTGDARLEDVASMQEAVELIERLRNDEGVEDVRLFREVPLKMRTYYKVEVEEDSGEQETKGDTLSVEPAPAETVDDRPPPGAMNLAPPPAATASAAATAVEELDEEPRRASLFNRS